MKFLKGLLVSVLSLILFATLSSLAFAFVLNQTILDPNFTAAEIDKVDMAAVASSIIQVPDSGNGPNAFIPSATVNAAIASSIKDAEPELKSELRTALFATYDYLFSRSNNLNISISLDSIQTNLKSTLLIALKKSPPAQIGGYPYSSLSPTQINDAFNSYFDQLTKNLFNPIVIDSSAFDAQTMTLMRQIRQGIAYYQFWWLTIILILVLAAAIILLENNLRSSLRDLGFNLFFFGAIGILSDYLLNNYAAPSTIIPGLPEALSAWLNGFVNDMIAPFNTFSIAVAVIGAVLIAGSFFVPHKEVEKAS